MRAGRVSSVAIVGGGPAGATLGAYLARAGVKVALFDRNKRPPLVVGESLVPAVVPILRELGVEEEVASYSVLKEGATFCFNSSERLDIRFDEVRCATTRYSYNVPRHLFDATLLRAAVDSGVVALAQPARVVRGAGADRVELSAESLEAANRVLGGQPDFVVDAGGRARTIARLMDLPVVSGHRRDVALHAHHTGAEVDIPGNVHTDRLDHGWGWRIPLRDRVSVGIVVDAKTLARFGGEPETQYDAFLRQDSVLGDWIRPATRVTGVVRYSNYQLRATRGCGANWALVGDAFGFVDPVFSSGALISFESARDLANALLSGEGGDLARWEQGVLRRFDSWQRVIELFYDGRLLTLLKMGDRMRRTVPGRMVDWHFRKHMPRVFTGEGVTNPYSLGLVTFMARHALWRNDPGELAIAGS